MLVYNKNSLDKCINNIIQSNKSSKNKQTLLERLQSIPYFEYHFNDEYWEDNNGDCELIEEMKELFYEKESRISWKELSDYDKKTAIKKYKEILGEYKKMIYKLSIDKKYNKVVNYINDFIKENMQGYLTNKVYGKDRVYYEFESDHNEWEFNELFFQKLVRNCFLVFMKLNKFEKIELFKNLSYEKCMMLCSLLCFDNKYEQKILLGEIYKYRDINIDGILNFRLIELKEKWDGLISAADRLLDVSSNGFDILDISSFISGTELKDLNNISFVKNKLFNNTKNKFIKILNLFDNYEYNLIFSIIKEEPKNIDYLNANLSKDLIGVIKYLNNGNKNTTKSETTPLEKGGNIIYYDFANKKEIK